MTAHTYQSLIDTLVSYTRDGDPELVAELPRLIAVGEARVYGDLELDTLNVEQPIALPANTSDVDKPSNCVAVQSLQNGQGRELYERTVGFVNRMLSDDIPGDPTYWVELTPTRIRIAPMTDIAGTLTFRYQAPEEQLSPTWTTTWVSTVLGDLLQASCLWALEDYNKHEAGAAYRAGTYDVFLKQAQARLVGRGRQTARG